MDWAIFRNIEAPFPERRAGRLGCDAWTKLEDGIALARRLHDHGDAAIMASIAEALGLTLPGASSIPAVFAEHARMATHCGRHIVEMVWGVWKPSDFLTRDSFENAIVTDMAVSGPTNAIIHLIAFERRAGIDITLDDFDRLSQTTPVIANLRPVGKYLMSDFFPSAS